MPPPLSPAQRHRARILQQQAQVADPYGTEVKGDAYDLMRIKLLQDKAKLSHVQSHERRAEMKAKLLPEYFDWIETAIDTGNGAADRVLTTIMVWCFDAGAYALGLRIAHYVVTHKMPMADDYKRSAAAIVIDELANAFLRGKWAPLDPTTSEDGTRQLTPAVVPQDKVREHTAALLYEAHTLTEGLDAPDQARAKLLKALAYAALGKVQTADEPDLAAIEPDALRVAHEVLQRALTLDSNSGVKKDIERIERALNKVDKAATVAADAPTVAEPQTPATATPAPARKTTAAKTAKAPARKPPAKR